MSNKTTDLTLLEAGATWAKLGWAGVVTSTMYTCGVVTVAAESAQDHANNNKGGLIDKGLTLSTEELADRAKELGREHMTSAKETLSFSSRKSATETNTNTAK